MLKNKIHNITIILKSCLTGTAVWIYQGPSRNAARLAYWRACKKEVERVGRLAEAAERRRANILRMLSELTAGMPATAEMPPEKKRLARQLLALAERKIPAGAFYEHIMEERRRREEDRRIRRQMRERENHPNTDYDKQDRITNKDIVTE